MKVREFILKNPKKPTISLKAFMFKKCILFKMHTACNTINKYNSLVDFYELRKMSNSNRRNFAPEEDNIWMILIFEFKTFILFV